MSTFFPREDADTQLRDEGAVLGAVQDTLGGRTDAFQTIVERYTPALYALSLRMLGNTDDAEEAVQEIFLRAYSSLRQFRLEKRFLPWIYTIALNHLRSLHRKKTRRRLTERVLPHEELVSGLADKSTTDPSARLVMQEAELAAARALLKLRHEYRAAFVLKTGLGFSVREISKLMNIPEGTVKTFLHRAREQLVRMITRA